MFKPFFVSFSLLALCVLPFGDTAHTEPDNTPFKFKVCVLTREDDSNLEKRLQTFIKRELRALGDVDVVSVKDRWKFLLQFDILEIELKNGNKTGWLSIAYSRSMAIEKEMSGSDQNFGYATHLYFPYISAAHWSVDKLHEYAIETVGNFDDILATHREWREK